MYCVTRWGRIPLAVLQPSTQTPSPKTDSISQKICLSYANPKSQNPGFCKTNEPPNLLANPTKKCWRQKSPQYSTTTLPLPAMSVASFSLRNFDGQMATAHFGKLPTLVQVSVPWLRYRFHIFFSVIGWLIDVSCISSMVSQVFRWLF